MMSKELKEEAKSYVKRKFNEAEQAYLHDIIAQSYYDGAGPREKRIIRLKASLSDVSIKSVLRILVLKKQLAKAGEQIEKMKECANCPVWLLNQTEKNCKDCKYKEALILLRR